MRTLIYPTLRARQSNYETARAPVLVVQYYRLAKREEVEMEEAFGESYREYKKRVPMFLPKLFNLRVSA